MASFVVESGAQFKGDLMRIVVVIAIFSLISSISIAKTINIPADYPTIQQGIDAAVNWDTVLVAPGTYFENIDFKGKDITVESDQGANVTIIDGNQAGSVVTCKTGEGPDSVLDEFTITNGSGTNIGGRSYGGGMYNKESNPTVTNSIFLENRAFRGGGMCNEWGSPTIIGCSFHNNWVESEEVDIPPTGGGGMYNYECNSTVTHCTFIKNHATDGGGMYNEQSSPKILNCTFYKNSASCGGGMGAENSNPAVINCTFSGNTGAEGGGMCYFSICNPIVINCILWKNTPPEIHITAGNPQVAYSCVQGGWPGIGNIDEDPLFADEADGDFHLTYPSPCKDSGDNSVLIVLTEDFEDDPRLAYEKVDIGADEFYTHLYWTGDATPNGNVEMKFVGIPGLTTQLWLGSGIMNPPMNTKYGDWHLQFPLLLNVGMGAILANGVLTIPYTFPANTPTPLTLPFQSGIGMKLTNLSVMDVE